jgi:tetratricopeptide (TPR) repeat protein
MSLKYYPKRVSELVLRAAYLHQGNALSALDRNEEAIEAYEKSLPFLESETRCARIDWERSSVLVNIGNCHSRLGSFAKANEYYDKAEKLGIDHLESERGDKAQGMGIKLVAMRARAFTLKKEGMEDKAKSLLRQVLEMQQEFTKLMVQERAEMKAELAEKKDLPQELPQEGS